MAKQPHPALHCTPIVNHVFTPSLSSATYPLWTLCLYKRPATYSPAYQPIPTLAFSSPPHPATHARPLHARMQRMRARSSRQRNPRLQLVPLHPAPCAWCQQASSVVHKILRQGRQCREGGQLGQQAVVAARASAGRQLISQVLPGAASAPQHCTQRQTLSKPACASPTAIASRFRERVCNASAPTSRGPPQVRNPPGARPRLI